MIRIRFVLSRVCLLLLLVGCAVATLNPLLRMWIQCVADELPVNVRVARVEHEFPDSTLQLKDVTLFSGHEWDKSQISAAELNLQLVEEDLLRKRVMAECAQLSGIHVQLDRPQSGKHLPHVFLPSTANKLAQSGRTHLERYVETVKQTPNSPFQMQGVAQDIEQRRRRNYLRLDRRAKALLTQAIQTMPQDNSSPYNPLRKSDAVRQKRSMMDAIGTETATVDEELARLANQYKKDLAALQSAKAVDIKRAQERFQFSPLDQAELTAYFLAPDVDRQITELITWIKRGRKFLLPQQSGSQSQFTPFAQSSRSGTLFIKSMNWDDESVIDGRAVQTKGSMANISPSPQDSNQPMTLDLQLLDSTETQIHVIFHRASDQRRDEITVQCKLPVSPNSIIGQDENLTLDVRYAQRAVVIKVTLDGDQMSGKITFVDTIDTIAISSPVVEDARLASAQSMLKLEELRSITTTATLAGTISRPDWQVESGLGRQLVHPLNTAFKTQLDAQRRQYLERIDKSFRLHASRIQSVTSQLHYLVREKVDGINVAITRTRRQLGPTLGLSRSLR